MFSGKRQKIGSLTERKHSALKLEGEKELKFSESASSPLPNADGVVHPVGWTQAASGLKTLAAFAIPCARPTRIGNWMSSQLPSLARRKRRLRVRSWFFYFLSMVLVCACRPKTQPSIPIQAIHHNNLGVALMDEGTKDPTYFPEAAKEFESGLKIAPDYLTARINLGMALFYSGESSKALAALEEIAKVAPQDVHVHYMLGLLKEMGGDFNEATQHFQEVTRQDPQDPNAWYHLGYGWSKLRQYRQSIEPFRKAAAIAPYQRRFRYNLFMALNRAGDLEEAQVELDRFKQLETSDIRVVEAPKSSLDYLKQGKYAEAISDSREEPAAASTPTHYTDVAHALGIRFEGSRGGLDPVVQQILRGESWSSEWMNDAANRRKLVEAHGSGAAFADANNDGRLDAFLVNGEGTVALFEQQTDGRFEDATVRAGLGALSFPGMACAWGDWDNDGWPDLVVTGYGGIRLYRNREGTFRDVTGAAGLSGSVRSSSWLMGAAFADLDHDGDLDLYVAGFVDLNRLPPSSSRLADLDVQPNLLFRNNGNGTFTEMAKEAHAAGGDRPTKTVWVSDVNDDRAIDIVLLDGSGRPRVLLNSKDGTFAASGELPAQAPPSLPAGEARAYGDFNKDGAVDEIILRNTGPAVLNRNEQKPQNWLAVTLEGYALPGKVKSNRFGIGTKVEVRSAGRWEWKELRAGNGQMGSDAASLPFDLGEQTSVDFVRAIFPSGVRWTLKQVRSNQEIKIQEPLLDVSSCPTLFAWNGRRFEFITDTLGAGVVGELVAPHEYWLPDPDEWVRVDGDQLAVSANGTLDLRFTNPLEEVTYLDEVRLLVADHPLGVEVHPNERMVGRPDNRARAEIFALNRLRPVLKATDRHGHDFTAALQEPDRVEFDHFEFLPFKGFANEWSLDLDLGSIEPGEKPVLLLLGWSYWNSSASVVAAAQAHCGLRGPSLEVLGTDRRWRMGIDDLGVPAGLPKTAVVDLSPVLRPGERLVRIRSNRVLYYDQVRVGNLLARQPADIPITEYLGGLKQEERAEAANFLFDDPQERSREGSKLQRETRNSFAQRSRGIGSGTAFDSAAGSPSPMRVFEIPLLLGELRWLGYPKRSLPDGKLPEVFDYDQIGQEAEWSTHSGMLTRYGDVRSLLRSSDDHFAIMGHGDEIALSFEASHLPPLPAGCRRTFLFYSRGFEKGYSALTATVEPLPFEGMKFTPLAPAASLHATRRSSYHYEWNTRPSWQRRRSHPPAGPKAIRPIP